MKKYLFLIMFAIFGVFNTAHGMDFFDVSFLHDRGIKGSNARVAIIEMGFPDPEHPAFKEEFQRGKITSHFIQHHPNIRTLLLKNPEWEKYYRALFLGSHESELNKKDNSHANKVLGVLKEEEKGVAPLSHANIYAKSIVRPTIYLPVYYEAPGLSHYTVQDYFDKISSVGAVFPISDYEYPLDEILTALKKGIPDLFSQKLNDTLLKTIVEAANKKNHAINISNYLGTLLDPFNSNLDKLDSLWKVPEPILEALGDALEKGNSVLVLSANNDRADLTESALNLGSPMERKRNSYFLQLASDPKIGPRLIIAGNIQSYSYLEEGKMSFKLNESSNWPGTNKNIQNNYIGAPGTSILLPDSKCTFSSATGTSFSAPFISGVIALMQDRNFQMHGSYLEAAEVVQRIRTTAYHSGDPCRFGQGAINIRKLFPDIICTGNFQ